MLTIRRSEERGTAAHGWLHSRHTFSFAEYHDPHYMGFGVLRVINEDRIQGGTGFGEHPHRDMEIISYVVEGALAHKDSMGNQAVIRPGEVQRMSAGTGVVHAEMNQESAKESHFFQIWITPNRRGLAPGYGQKDFEPKIAAGGLVLTVSASGRDGSISINQDADVYIARLRADERLRFQLKPERSAWVQVVKGDVTLNRQSLGAGDGASVTDEEALEIVSGGGGEILLFDLPRVSG